jgi:hypothetical protein
MKMRRRQQPNARQSVRFAAALAAMLLMAAPQLAVAQINLQGITRPNGILNISTTTSSTPQTHQYTHIWAYAPPSTAGGAQDNANFTSHVMNLSTVDGVSILEAWNSIEQSPPSPSPCATSDLCQPDPGAPGMYHTYTWTVYDSTTPTSPLYQWLAAPVSKMANILIAGEESGSTNPITPHYVTSPAWYNLFNPQRQDVINGLKDCTGGWGGSGPTGVTASISGSNIQVTDSNGCCNGPPTTSQYSPIQDQDLVWVALSPSQCSTGGTGATASVASGATTTFSYPLPAACTGMPALSSVTYIGKSQSWAVPYELPYLSALEAFWAAVVAHYGPSFTLGGHNYYSQLNYFRFGGSVGSEWYPYCTSGGASGGLESLSSPYKYIKKIDSMHTSPPYTGWLNYYQEMGNYLQSLSPPFKIVHSINAAETPTDYDYGTQEAGYAVTWFNRFGVRDGFGSQGLSAQDSLSCSSGGCPVSTCVSPTTCSASNWYPMFEQYNSYGVPLELQPIALSYPGDTMCTNGCSVSTFSGDLPTYLYTFSTSVGATDYEIYWRDLSLAYDGKNYCAISGPTCNPGTSISLGNELSATDQFSWFGLVGVGKSCGGTQAGGDNCTYGNNVSSAHGQH